VDREAEIAILQSLLQYSDTKTTTLADSAWQNPVSAYTCPDRHRQEEALLIRGRPLVWGLSCDWPKPGSYRTDDYSGVPVLTVRGRDGKLRAFINTCRHRGAKVASGEGEARVFKCPYHAWVYRDDGGLRAVPEADCFPGVLQNRPSLTALPLAEKHGMVWVLPTPVAVGAGDLDIDPWLRDLAGDLDFWKLSGYHLHARHVQYEQMNWKLLIDTFLEGYHFGFLHAETLRNVLKPNICDFHAFGASARLVYARAKIDRLHEKPQSEWDLMWNSTIVYSMFANTIFSPQGDHMEVYRIFPVDGRPDRAVMETSLYIPKPAETADEIRHWDANLALAIKVITTEDFPTGRSMQIGFGSGAQSHVIYGRNEPALTHYHQSIRQALGLATDDPQAAMRRAAE
jgi:phenylpropionate dioxygenase-like ring-hydroxylating dioxygenase large terminal subunit